MLDNGLRETFYGVPVAQPFDGDDHVQTLASAGFDKRRQFEFLEKYADKLSRFLHETPPNPFSGSR